VAAVAVATSRLALPYPVATDPNNVPGDMGRLANAVDAIAVVYAEGLAAARPAAAIDGRIYRATDTGALYYDTGSAWLQINFNTASLVTAKGDLLAATGSGVLARLGVGSNGQVLSAQSGQASGLQWASVLGLPLALTGAAAATRYVGGTASGAPSSGTFAVGDFVVTGDGHVWICTAAGSPGTWIDAGAATKGLPAALTGATAATRYVGGTTSGAPSSGTFAKGDYVIGQDGSISWCTAAGSPGTWTTFSASANASALSAIQAAAFGAAGRTYPPVCALNLSAARGIGANNDTFMDAQWSVVNDPDGIWHSGIQPSGGYMQVPYTGRYRVRHLSLWDGASNCLFATKILLNGTTVTANAIASDIMYVATGVTPTEPWELRADFFERRLTAGDKLYFSVWGNNGGTVEASAFGGVQSHAALYWIGPN
jgi:hypothetical protein